MSDERRQTMNTLKTGRTTSILFLAFFLGLIGLVIYIMTPKFPKQMQPIYSPTHINMAIPVVNTNRRDMTKYLCIKISIVDTKSGRVMFEEQTSASSRMNWSIRWIEDNFLILESSDIGQSCWQGKNGKWMRTDCPN
jgi:hypothetical protein